MKGTLAPSETTEIRFSVFVWTKTEKTTTGDKSGLDEPGAHTGGVVTRSRSNFDDGSQCGFENEIFLRIRTAVTAAFSMCHETLASGVYNKHPRRCNTLFLSLVFLFTKVHHFF